MLFKVIDLLNEQVADGLLCQHPEGGIGYSRYSLTGPRRLPPFTPIAGAIPRVTGLLRAMFSVIIP